MIYMNDIILILLYLQCASIIYIYICILIYIECILLVVAYCNHSDVLNYMLFMIVELMMKTFTLIGSTGSSLVDNGIFPATHNNNRHLSIQETSSHFAYVYNPLRHLGLFCVANGNHIYPNFVAVAKWMQALIFLVCVLVYLLRA